jgi:hypothetical protein
MATIVTRRLADALNELKLATDARHQLRRGSTEYLTALEQEVRLASEIRRLVEADRTEGRRD